MPNGPVFCAFWRRIRRCTLLATALLLAAATSSANDEIFQVNDYTTGLQRSVTVDCEAGGGYLVTWLSGSGTDAVRCRRRLALNGQPIGTEYAISNSNAVVAQKTATNRPPRAAFDLGDEGQFVVVSWTEDYVDG
jgi:hypothetical protein